MVPVNTEGVMGAGLALAFKKKFPEESKVYIQHCKENGMAGGDILVVPVKETKGTLKALVFAATKEKWKNPSTLVWVEASMNKTKRLMKKEGYLSVSIPKLGCGLGGLAWKDVLRCIRFQVSHCRPKHFYIFGEYL
jgi:O-acetyl-ADP-ribose deacetylase (regulator of RNase III)